MNDQPPILPYDDTQVTSNPAPLDEAAITAKVEQRLRQQLAELSEVAAQAQRLGVAVDPAQALARGITPDALRQSVLKQAAERDVAKTSWRKPRCNPPHNPNPSLTAPWLKRPKPMEHVNDCPDFPCHPRRSAQTRV